MTIIDQRPLSTPPASYGAVTSTAHPQPTVLTTESEPGGQRSTPEVAAVAQARAGAGAWNSNPAASDGGMLRFRLSSRTSSQETDAAVRHVLALRESGSRDDSRAAAEALPLDKLALMPLSWVGRPPARLIPITSPWVCAALHVRKLKQFPKHWMNPSFELVPQHDKPTTPLAHTMQRLQSRVAGKVQGAKDFVRALRPVMDSDFELRRLSDASEVVAFFDPEQEIFLLAERMHADPGIAALIDAERSKEILSNVHIESCDPEWTRRLTDGLANAFPTRALELLAQAGISFRIVAGTSDLFTPSARSVAVYGEDIANAVAKLISVIGRDRDPLGLFNPSMREVSVVVPGKASDVRKLHRDVTTFQTIAVHEVLHGVDILLGTDGEALSSSQAFGELFASARANHSVPTENSKQSPAELFADAGALCLGPYATADGESVKTSFDLTQRSPELRAFMINALTVGLLTASGENYDGEKHLNAIADDFLAIKAASGESWPLVLQMGLAGIRIRHAQRVRSAEARALAIETVRETRAMIGGASLGQRLMAAGAREALERLDKLVAQI